MRVYVENTVWGFAFNRQKRQWQLPSIDLFRAVLQGQHQLVVSDEIESELLQGAPTNVLTFYYLMQSVAVANVATTNQVRRLADLYVSEGIVPAGKPVDALHVAHATIAECDALVSWDGTHIVKKWRIAEYNRVNQAQGYGSLIIATPAAFLQQYP